MSDSIPEAEYHALVAKDMPEKQLQDAIIGAAQRLGWLVYHTHDSRRSAPGFPDLVLVHPIQKRTLFRELKTQTGRVTPAQQAWLDALNRAGQDARVWRALDWTNGTIANELYDPNHEGI